MEEKYLRTLLEDNLINEKTFKLSPDKIDKLECFHYSLPKDPRFESFNQLKEIRIIEEDIYDLNWLEGVPLLENLYIFHTKVNNIEGLVHCKNLKKVLLEGNNINKFPDISSLLDIEVLSVSNNPLTGPIIFPKNDSLKHLSLAGLNLKSIDKSIVKLSKLEKLDLSANNFCDYSSLVILSKIASLSVLYFDNPMYGRCPICSYPNYCDIVILSLQNIEILDTYQITKKYKNILSIRKRELEIFYDSVIGNYLSYISHNQRLFCEDIAKSFNELKHSHYVISENLWLIQSTICENDADMFDSIKIVYNFNRFAFLAGGIFSIQYINKGTLEWSTFTESITEFVSFDNTIFISHLWEVSYLPLLLSAKNKQKGKKQFIIFNNSRDVLNFIENINSSQFTLLPSLSNCKAPSYVFYVDTYADTNDNQSYSITHFFILSRSQRYIAQSICDTIKQNSLYDIKEISNNNELFVIKKQFDVIESLVDVTLVECGITSINIFSKLINLKYLKIPRNKVSSLADLPPLPVLELLDVSFNILEDVSALFPNEKSACEPIQQTILIGNPVFTPNLVMLLKQIFPNHRDNFIDRVHSPVIYTLDRSLYENVSSIDISNNCITTLKPLSELPLLDRLIAFNNNLKEFDISSPTLTYADVSFNYITYLPNEKMVPSLTTLVINYNKVKELTQLRSLLVLYASDNQIENLPSSAFYPRIISLSIQNNPFSIKIDAYRFLYQFKTLKMLNGNIIKASYHLKAQNKLQGMLFPEDLADIVKPGTLTLELSGRNYKNVDVLRCKSLVNLDLSDNLLSEINWEKNSFPSLATLLLASNQLSSFNFIKDLSTLQVLNLSSNKITDELFKTLILIKLPNLKTLNISRNSLRNFIQIPSENFPLLTNLNLSYNFIISIQKDAFMNLPIEVLDLSHNSLKKLDNLSIESLRSLNVSHNRITFIDEVEKLRSNINLTQFFFNDNPLNQKSIHRIRVLFILRTLTELDGKAVTENDLAQVRIQIEQSSNDTGQQSLPGIVQTRINKVIIAPVLPSLHESPMIKRLDKQIKSKGRNFR